MRKRLLPSDKRIKVDLLLSDFNKSPSKSPELAIKTAEQVVELMVPDMHSPGMNFYNSVVAKWVADAIVSTDILDIKDLIAYYFQYQTSQKGSVSPVITGFSGRLIMLIKPEEQYILVEARNASKGEHRE